MNIIQKETKTIIMKRDTKVKLHKSSNENQTPLNPKCIEDVFQKKWSPNTKD